VYVSLLVPSGLNNTQELQLLINSDIIDHTQMSRVQLVVDRTTTLDSSVAPTLFDFTQTDRLVLKLGSAGLPLGFHTAKLITYDGANPLGILWNTPIRLIVI
jgi:hypothetical protein